MEYIASTLQAHLRIPLLQNRRRLCPHVLLLFCEQPDSKLKLARAVLVSKKYGEVALCLPLTS